MPAGRRACDDLESCTVDLCDEAHGECYWQRREDASCAKCAGEPCEADCAGKMCGSDGCEGSCGRCPDGSACLVGACVSAMRDGACAAPFLLLPPTFAPVQLSKTKPFDFEVHGTTANSVNEIVPLCNIVSDARETIYTFDVPKEGQRWGILASVTGTKDDGSEYDTVLELRKGNCHDQLGTVACADDSTPPGGLSSSINALVDEGRYYLFVDGYSVDEVGPFTLKVRLYADCQPNCDGALCGGTDLCGGTCGECADDEHCNTIQRCAAKTCVPNCAGKQCGDDGCGATCGGCPMGTMCWFAGGKCLVPAGDQKCNAFNPVCDGGCADKTSTAARRASASTAQRKSCPTLWSTATTSTASG